MLFRPQSLTPTLVRPQTFDPLQSPDSDSPSVRFQQKLLSTCCLDILPVRASYESCSWGKPPRPHFRAFPHRTSYIQFSRCIVPTAWFSLFSTRLLSHTWQPFFTLTNIEFTKTVEQITSSNCSPGNANTKCLARARDRSQALLYYQV